MSNKKYKHWCDDKFKEPEDNKFIIGDLASKIYEDLEKYLIHDINKDIKVVFPDPEQDKLARAYVVKKMYRILDTAEEIQNSVYETNSIYGWYDVDFEERRKGWLKAKAYCYRLITQLSHMGTKTLKGTNVQKYVSLANDAHILSQKIKNAITADDKRRKSKSKTYISGGS